MKILVVETVNRTPHLETSFEVIKNHLDAGDEVHFCFLGHAVENTHWVITAQSVDFLPEEIGVSLLRHPRLFIHRAKGHSSDLRISFPDISSVDDLLNLRYQGYSVGDSAFSTISQVRGSKYINLEKEKNNLFMIMRSGIYVYECTRSLVRSVKPDRVYTFNGRFSSSRAIVDAAREWGVECFVHERGANKSRYVIRPFPLHDLKHNSRFVERYTRRVSSDQVRASAGNWYHERRAGKPSDWHSFTEKQSQGLGVRHISLNRRIVTYFSSTEQEFVGLFGVNYIDNAKTQRDVIEQLIRFADEIKDTTFIVLRIHPNERCENMLRWYERLSLSSNVKIFFPNDPIDTYQLIDDSVLTLSCGSTVTPESVYWGTPSISLASSDYEMLGCCYTSEKWGSVQSLICNPPARLDSQLDGSLRYGYYRATFGEKFRHYSPDNLFTGTFMGVRLHGDPRLMAVGARR